MDLLGVVLAPSALQHQLLCIGFRCRPVQSVTESFGNQGFGRSMMATLALMNFPKDLDPFLRFDAALEHSGCASVVNFTVDDGVSLGSSNDASSFGFVT